MESKPFAVLLWGMITLAGCLGTTARVSPTTPLAAPEEASQEETAPPIELAEPAAPPPVEASPARSDHDEGEVFADLPRGNAQLDALCARGNADPVSEALCARPSITGLADLQRAVGLLIADPTRGNGEGGNPSFALLSHSTSIAGRLVSAINPRAFLFTNPASIARMRGSAQRNPSFVAMGVARGEQLVELVARDRKSQELRFFLVRFSQACNQAGCSAYDLFSPALETGWTEVSVYEDRDLVNTVLDCQVCHQPGGPGTAKLLRMQELQEPWTHFFRAKDEGKEIITDYFRAHDYKESYAGIPAFIVSHSQPARLEGLLENEGFRAQPNEFPTASMALELGSGKAPEKSYNWQAVFRGPLAGTEIPSPYAAGRASDPARLAKAAAAYRAVMAGKAPRAEMPSLADLHREEARWMTGITPKPGLAARGILQQMCQRCHNPSLDQRLTRSLFDVTRLDALSRHEKDEAIRRLTLPFSSARKMPPPRFGELGESEIAAVIAELRR
ncbi:MAG: hypothetical protein ABI193_25350 [Minicystis sp.]